MGHLPLRVNFNRIFSVRSISNRLIFFFQSGYQQVQLSFFSSQNFQASEFGGAGDHLVFGKSSEMLSGFSKGCLFVLFIPFSVLFPLHLLGPKKLCLSG